MNCIHCGSADTVVFYIERIPCSHCNETTELVYEACNDCNLMWKSVDGNVLNNSFDVMETLDDLIIDGDLLEEMPTEEELKKMFEEFEAVIDAAEYSDAKSMKDMIHRCLRCETVSYEINPKHYHCPDCGFEWEIL